MELPDSRGSVTGQQLECDLFDECAGHNRTSLRYEPQFQRLSLKIVLSARRASARNVIKRGWPADSRWPQAPRVSRSGRALTGASGRTAIHVLAVSRLPLPSRMR